MVIAGDRPFSLRKLGYGGKARFAAFHYDPQRDAVIWGDGQASGLAMGAWSTLAEDVAPLPKLSHAAVESGPMPQKALVLDRIRQRSHVTPQASAQRFLAQQHDTPQ